MSHSHTSTGTGLGPASRQVRLVVACILAPFIAATVVGLLGDAGRDTSGIAFRPGDGALFGATPEEAFYVRIDEALNPFSEQQLGRLHIEVGVRPSYPAEFIIVRIGIWAGGSSRRVPNSYGTPRASPRPGIKPISASSPSGPTASPARLARSWTPR